MRNIQFILFIIYCFSINFELWDPFNSNIDYLITKITATAYLMSTLADFKYLYNFKYFKPYLYPLWLLFILFTLMNYLSINTLSSNIISVPFLLSLLILHTSVNLSIVKPNVLIYGLYSFAIGSVMLTILYLFKYETSYTISDRITIFGNNQNALGIMLCISMLVIIIMTRKTKKNQLLKILLYSFIPPMFYFMIETGSRVAFISFGLGMGLYFTIKGKSSLKTIRRFGIVILLYVLTYVLFLRNTYVIDRLKKSVFEGDLSGRDIRWNAIGDIVQNNFLIGIGQNGYNSQIAESLGYYTSPHNVFIEILAYSGIIGLILFNFFLYKIIQKTLYDYKFRNELLPIVLIVPVLGILVSGQIFEKKIIWIIFSFIISISYINQPKFIKA